MSSTSGKQERDIYFEGKIRVGAIKQSADFTDIYLYTLPSYEIIGTHNWVDGQDVSGKYVTQTQWYSHTADRWDNCTKEQYEGVAQESARRIIAVPLYPTVGVPERWVNIYNNNDTDRFISDEDYSSFKEAYDGRDKLSGYVETVCLTHPSTPQPPVVERSGEDVKECEHYFVPIGEYEQLGKFICIHCKQQK